jgi:hypothetical protein
MTEEELDRPATKRDIVQAVSQAVTPLASKAELAEAIARLATKAELAAAIAPLATKPELTNGLASLEGSLRAEMQAGFAQLMQAILTVQSQVRGMREEHRISLGITEEEWARRVGVLDDKFHDLPSRVDVLEHDTSTVMLGRPMNYPG